MMNAEIETIFTGFSVDDVEIPVAFMFYDGGDDASSPMPSVPAPPASNPFVPLPPKLLCRPNDPIAP